MPEAIFLSIRRRPANEAGAVLSGHVNREGTHACALGIAAPAALSIAEAVRLIQREAR